MGRNVFHFSSAASQPKRGRSLVVWGAALGALVVLGCLLLCVILGRRLALELRKADPIRGITIVVDTGNAVDAKEIDHAAHAYLNRRLRAAGYDQPDVKPLRIDVVFRKIGTIDYNWNGKQVSADKVRLEMAFYDAAGKHLQTVTAEPKMHSSEDFQYDAEIELNKAAYGRAVNQILHIELPRPATLFANGTTRGTPASPTDTDKRPGVASGAGPPMRNHPLGAGLIVHVPFEDGAGTSVGNSAAAGSRGELRGNADWVAGPVGTALQFDGTTHVDFGHAAPLDRTNGFSICVWIKRTSDKGMKIVSRLDDRERGYDLALIRGVVWFQLLHDPPQNCLQVTTASPTSLGEWHHLAATYDGSSKASGVRIYVDGQPAEIRVRRDTLTETVLSSGRLRIGKHTRAKYGDFEGTIDDVRIYDRVLSPSEVAELCELGR